MHAQLLLADQALLPAMRLMLTVRNLQHCHDS
jgi:hypothetical protein